MADMGGAELLERQPEPEAEPEEKKASVNEPAEAEIAHEKPSPKIAQDKVPAPEPAKEQPTEQRAEVLLGKKMEEDDIHEIKALVGHKVSEDAPGRIIIQVKWVDDSEITWEPEENIQDGASEMLFDYWKKQGGREGALFQKGSKPLLGEQYWVYKILNHERVRSAFRFHVQWVGYPADATNTSWETEAKLKKCAQELLDEYWAMKGGRDQFLAKRGRAKKARTE
ncbi:hypothetical protein BKA67DRAFT_126754 [Truncatella angustata]|uniref:Chromo domain-containing protein n=1 Tax=Truncatella angustata TaxID=152316 RepID=A0A9P8RFC8_9PEZI|nr:uncharacterized protein BKA67DRAFT_126754 [Truncatella angustata]KAH6644993.1 hypothetical protein BKA67DRAFT_126754 [Truncatella angustata]